MPPVDDAPAVDDPLLVVCVSWRPLGGLTDRGVDALSRTLEQADPEYCWQFPAPGGDVHVVSLAGAGSPRSAAADAVASLRSCAAAARVGVTVLRVDVVDDEASWDVTPVLEAAVGTRPATDRRGDGGETGA